MKSHENEVIKLVKKIDVNHGEKKGNVELWLAELEIIMKKTIKNIIKQTMKDINTDRIEWILKWPA
jgi:dynein heavy chain